MFIKKLNCVFFILLLSTSLVHAREAVRIPVDESDGNIVPKIINAKSLKKCRCAYKFELQLNCIQDASLNPNIVTLLDYDFSNVAQDGAWFPPNRERGYDTLEYGPSDDQSSYLVEGSVSLDTLRKRSCTSDEECMEYCHQTMGNKYAALLEDVEIMYDYYVRMIFVMDPLNFCITDGQTSQTEPLTPPDYIDEQVLGYSCNESTITTPANCITEDIRCENWLLPIPGIGGLGIP